MELYRHRYNGKLYIFRNYGDGWDVYYVSNTHVLLEEGCSTMDEAIAIAKEHAFKEAK